MSRRKRQAVAIDEPLEQTGDEVEVETAPSRRKRRKLEKARKLPTLSSRAESLSLEIELLGALFETAKTHREEDSGRLVASAFLRLPNKKSFPAYFSAVQSPIDLSRIGYNVKVGRYRSGAACMADFDLLFRNTRAFYKASSPECRDASVLEDLLHLQLDNLECLGGGTAGAGRRARGEGPPPPSAERGRDKGRTAREREREREREKEREREREKEEASLAQSEGEPKSRSTPRRTRAMAQAQSSPLSPPPVLALSEEEEQPGHLPPPPEPSKEQDKKKRKKKRKEKGKAAASLGGRAHKGGGSGVALTSDLSTDELQEEGERSDPLHSLVSSPPPSSVEVSLGKKEQSRRKRKRKRKMKNITDEEEGDMSFEEKEVTAKVKRKSGPSTPATAATAALTVKISLTGRTAAKEKKKKKKKSRRAPGQEGEGAGLSKISKACLSVYSAVVEKQDSDGRVPSDLFMQRPSPKLYPAYYLAIPHPIDLQEICASITTGKYPTMRRFLEDLDRLFQNAQTFNEEESLVYRDSVTLSCAARCQLTALWTTTAPVPGEELEELLAVMTTSQEPETFPLAGREGVYFLSSRIHDYLGLTRGDLFRWFPEIRVSTSAEQRKDISGRGICANSLGALRVVSREDVSSFLDLKAKGYTGRQLVKALVPRNPRSAKKEAGSRVASGDSIEVEESPTGDQAVMRDVMDAIYTVEGVDGHRLSATLHQVPQKWAKADHTLAGKRLLDLQLIKGRVTLGHYSSSAAMFDDLHLMCQHICHLMPEGSTPYLDALFLHDFVLKKREQILKENQSLLVPEAQYEVQKMLKTVVKRMTSESSAIEAVRSAGLPLEDEEGRSQEELVPLDTIVSNVQKGYYHRLDRMQEDLLNLLEHVRRSTDPAHRAGGVALTRAYLRARDEVCEEGQRLSSPALLLITLSDFEEEVAAVSANLDQLDPQSSSPAPGSPSGTPPPETPSPQARSRKKAAVEESEEKPLPLLAPPLDLLSDDGGDEDFREYVEEVECEGHTYFIGDYVYVEPKQADKPYHIVLIDQIWRQVSTNEHWFSGPWFIRPEETFHQVTRKFYDKELFKTEMTHMVRLPRVRGKCCVLFIKDYQRHTPTGLGPEDVFVCESRYSRLMKTFKKFKVGKTWTVPGSHHPELIRRPEPFTMPRVPSVFLKTSRSPPPGAGPAPSPRGGSGTSQEEEEEEPGSHSHEPEVTSGPGDGLGRDDAMETGSGSPLLEGETPRGGSLPGSDVLEEGSSSDQEGAPGLNISREEGLIDFLWENVEVADPSPAPDRTHYQQFVIDGNRFRTGDFVFVRSEESRPYIARIDRMWTDQKADPYFAGSWFVHSDEVSHPVSQLFFRKEVLMSNIEDTNPMRSVIGRCAVLAPKDYAKFRPTEIFEEDVFVCHSKYYESVQEIKKHRVKTWKNFNHSKEVAPEEIYYFKEEIPLIKVASPNLAKTIQTCSQAAKTSEDTTEKAKPSLGAPGVSKAKKVPAAKSPYPALLTTPTGNPISETISTLVAPATALTAPTTVSGVSAQDLMRTISSLVRSPTQATPPISSPAPRVSDATNAAFPMATTSSTPVATEEQSCVSMAMALMAEEVQKTMTDRRINMPLEVVTKVVTAEWARMSELQRAPYEKRALMLRCASLRCGGGPQKGLPVSKEFVGVLNSLMGVNKFLSSATTPVTTPTTATANAAHRLPQLPAVQAMPLTTPTVTIGGLTLSPGMVLSQQIIQLLQTFTQQQQSVRPPATASTTTSHASRGSGSGQSGAVRDPPANTLTSEQQPQFVRDEGKKVIHGLLYLKYLDGLRQNKSQMSAWQSISTATQCQPDSSGLERAAEWVGEAISTAEGIHDNRSQMTATVEALKTLKDLLLRNSVDLAHYMEA